jgi:hypothetical protein
MRMVIERLRVPLPAVLLLLVMAPAVAAGPFPGVERDPSGLGLILPGGLWVSGDLTLSLAVPEGNPATAEIDDVSLLARYEPFTRFALFGELRLENLPEVIEAHGVETDAEVIFERLYGELLVTPRFSLRVGKVFTPFGLWNVIARFPFTWTVEEPAITEGVFPRRATGLSLIYQTTWQGWSLDATTYGPAQDEIVLHHTEDTQTGFLFGGRAAAGRELGPAFASLGVNAAGFRRYDRSRWSAATGLDLEVLVGGHEIMGEFAYREPTTAGHAVHGAYLQDAIPLVRGVHGVVRFEYFQPRHGRAEMGPLLGAFWRPVPNVIVRGGYLFATGRLENFEPGFQASFSLLF